LVSLDEEIQPYNETLNSKRADEVKIWAGEVVSKLKERVNLKEDEIIFLAGERYRKYVIPSIANYRIPLKGLGIGKQLQYLKNKIR